MRRYGWNRGEAAVHKLIREVAEALANDMKEAGMPQSVDEIEATMHAYLEHLRSLQDNE